VDPVVLYNHLFTFTCCFRGITGALPVRRLELPSTGVFLKTRFVFLSDLKFLIKVKTFNNGSLGSRIDEERSEMR
jgi:hypothetical protein